jgi:WhiB family redox-sensing transcriptional regulator
VKYPNFDGTQACASIGTDPFFPEMPANMTSAEKQAIHDTCYSCHMQAQCLEWGLRHEEHGFWGGVSPTQRRMLRRQVGIRLESVPVTVYLGIQRMQEAS